MTHHIKRATCALALAITCFVSFGEVVTFDKIPFNTSTYSSFDPLGSSTLTHIMLKQWYPDGSVTNISQWTQGLKYTFNSDNSTAFVRAFSSDRTYDGNQDATGAIVIPPYVYTNGIVYAVTGIEPYSTLVDTYGASVTSVVAPTTIKEVGTYAFSGCSELRSISLFSAQNIGSFACQGCSSLLSVHIPEATNIGMYAFGECNSLTKISLPSAIKIEGHAFYECGSLNDIDLPVATIIRDYAFSKCTSLTTITLPSATNIQAYAFQDCNSLTTASFPLATYLGSYLFNNCTKLSSISLPSVVGISTYAFKNCYGITKISLPSLLELGKGTFHSCSNLVSIAIPSATNVLEYSFAYCKSLSSIDFGNGLPCVARRGNSAFTKGTTSCVVVTPDSLYDAWIADESWTSLVPNGFRFMRHSEWEFDSSSGVNVASPNGVKEYIEFRVNEILRTQYGLTPIP